VQGDVGADIREMGNLQVFKSGGVDFLCMWGISDGIGGGVEGYSLGYLQAATIYMVIRR
jgi:hypothetical protein